MAKPPEHADPDQTALSGSALFSQTYLSENQGPIQYLLNISEKQYWCKHSVYWFLSFNYCLNLYPEHFTELYCTERISAHVPRPNC